MMKKYFLLFLTILLFGIVSAASQTQANITLNDKINDLQNFQLEIQEQDLIVQQNLNSIFDLSDIQTELNGVIADYSSINSSWINASEEYDAVIAKNSLIEIPKAILKTKTSPSLSIIPNEDNFDFDLLKELGWQEYEPSEKGEYGNALSGWTLNNIDLKISFDSFSIILDGPEEHFLTVFDLEISKNESIEYPTFIFIKKLENLDFKDDYEEIEEEGYYYIRISEENKTIGFSTTEDITLENLSFFIAPPVTQLNLGGSAIGIFKIGDKEKFKWTIFTLVMSLLFVIGIIIYAVLQAWYKKKYENYLFKNKNDLYNLANYISTAKKKKMDNQQIEENLKKSKWGNEQIRYALRKYSGRRTGMFEIPLGKIAKKEELFKK